MNAGGGVGGMHGRTMCHNVWRQAGQELAPNSDTQTIICPMHVACCRFSISSNCIYTCGHNYSYS